MAKKGERKEGEKVRKEERRKKKMRGEQKTSRKENEKKEKGTQQAVTNRQSTKCNDELVALHHGHSRKAGAALFLSRQASFFLLNFFFFSLAD